MSSLLSISASALTANQNVLNVIGNNIANVNTEGYSRQQAILKSIPGQYTGTGYYGKGVEITTINRIYDEFLTRQAATSKSVAAGDSVRSSYMQQLESLFPGGANGLGASVSELLNSFSDIANAPTDLTARGVTLARAEEMANRFRATAESINELRIGVNQQLNVDIAAINNLASQIASANREISLALGSGHTPNDLMDKRDQLVRDLNRYVQTSNVQNEDGTLTLFVGGSQPLVLGGSASTVALVGDDFNSPNQRKFAITFNGKERVLDTPLLGGGEVAGLLRFSNEDLVQAENMLGRMALSIGTVMNNQQALGLDLNGNVGNPLFNLASPPSAYNGKQNTGTLNNLSVGISLNDSTGTPDGMQDFLASNYEITFTSTGAAPFTAVVTRLSDGVQQTVSFADNPANASTNLEAEFDGLRLSFAAADVPALGDRFVIAPYSTASRSLNVAFTSPKELAMARPITAEAASNNKGALTLAGLSTRSIPTTPGPDVSLVFLTSSQYIRTDDAYYTGSPLEAAITAGLRPGDPVYDAAVLDYQTNATAGELYTYSPGTAIEADGRTTNLPFDPNTEWGWSLTLKGVPQPGDSFTVKTNPYTQLDAANAQAMMDLRDLALFDKAPLTDGYASMIADIGTKTLGAKQTAAVSERIAVSIEQDRTAVSGVNLDEEAARLLQFQQAYQAAGKAMQVAQTLFDTLIASVRA
ncbi:flagellar hook protein FlgK [Hylemonella gracilis str. Niagara R]|uniref:Flagellar hook-associated protein 1 n=1 Tax=Hylemonella gracilis str. Niagara R TaxID=1458275 RepID=A0A016XEJ4_9BURK|nr:flagellar hook-associated protein FlgK [Hylemonella gracilis]EYC49982.1 flagellar hook protein FlgK [Hylemonella gracilis str. Niagara R]